MEKVMDKIKYVIALCCSALFFCGCVAPKALDENHFSVSGTRLLESGVLELNGEYTEIFWGIAELRGKVSGETLTLSGLAEFWGDDAIQHSIAVPQSVSVVKFGNKVLWRRGESTEPGEGEAVVANSPDERPENGGTESEAAGCEPSTVSDGERQSHPADNAVASGNEKASVTHLRIGGNVFHIFDPQWLEFEEIFWGRVNPDATDSAVVRQLGADNAIYNFNGQTINEFQNLEVLEIRGTTYIRHADLSGLSLPKLRVLVLDQIEVTGLESANLPALEEFYLNDMRTVPLGKISLPPGLDKLHTAGIQSYAGNFDFASLAGKPLTALWIISDCRNFEFLRGMPLKNLRLNGFSAEPGALDVLKTLPLEMLALKPFRPISDWNFLSSLKLKKLSINVSGNRNFSLSCLQQMPLAVLRITGLMSTDLDAWQCCSNLPLKELVLFNSRVPDEFLRSKPIENVALFQCYWAMDDPFVLLNALPGVKHLAVWRMIRWHNGRQYGVMDRNLNWEKFVGRGVDSLCVSTANLNFLHKFPGITKVFIREIATPPLMESLRGREFEIFTLPAIYQRSLTDYSIKITGVPRSDMLTADW